MRIAALVALAALTIGVAACSSGPRERIPPRAVIQRALATAPGAAQPSDIVATELAYARAAKKQGQYTAGLEYAAPGAIFHTRNGGVPAQTLFSQLPNPETATQWQPRTVVMSCDGSLALSLGRFVDPEGFVGNYVTTWSRQQNGEYKWTYDVAGRDNPQPPPRAEVEDGDIVVTAIDAIEGLVATCPRAGEAVPPPPTIPVGEEGNADAKLSRDGTLRWRWEHRGDGTKYVAADYFYLGQWVSAIEESLTSPPES